MVHDPNITRCHLQPPLFRKPKPIKTSACSDIWWSRVFIFSLGWLAKNIFNDSKDAFKDHEITHLAELHWEWLLTKSLRVAFSYLSWAHLLAFLDAISWTPGKGPFASTERWLYFIAMHWRNMATQLLTEAGELSIVICWRANLCMIVTISSELGLCFISGIWPPEAGELNCQMSFVGLNQV